MQDDSPDVLVLYSFTDVLVLYSFTIPTSSHHRDILIKQDASKNTIAAHWLRTHKHTFDVLAIVFMIGQKSTGSLRELSLRSGSSPHVIPDYVRNYMQGHGEG